MPIATRLSFAPLFAIAAILATGACASTPNSPTSLATAGAAPVISSIAASNVRVEAGSQIHLGASVQDDSTPLDRLHYEWTATPVNGLFFGNGPEVTWQAPSGRRTPNLFTLTLNVSEREIARSQARFNNASANVQVHYNDSNAEVSDLTLQFLRDFTTFNLSAADCVRNFSDRCPGKAEEQSQIAANRVEFHIVGGEFNVEDVRFNTLRDRANITAPCTFYDIPTATGVRERVDGVCLLTSVYEDWRWRLCDSHFSLLDISPYSLMGQALRTSRNSSAVPTYPPYFSPSTSRTYPASAELRRDHPKGS